MTKTPHISLPIDEARRRINAANHHVYRAGHQDTAYELKRAVDKLNESLRLVQTMQRDYPFADPAKIDTSIPPDDPRIAPPPEDAGYPTYRELGAKLEEFAILGAISDTGLLRICAIVAQLTTWGIDEEKLVRTLKAAYPQHIGLIDSTLDTLQADPMLSVRGHDESEG